MSAASHVGRTSGGGVMIVSTSQRPLCAVPGPEWRWVPNSAVSGVVPGPYSPGYWMRCTPDGLAAVLIPAPPRSIVGL